MSAYKEKKLFTPGPLCVSEEVKRAMLVDLGSRDKQFMQCVEEVRCGLLKVAEVSPEDYTCVPLQGSGTYCIEAVIQTISPAGKGKVLVLANGAYGRRMVSICERAGVSVRKVEGPEHLPIPLNRVEDTLQSEGGWSLVCVVHCETSTGVINPVQEVTKLVQRYCPDSAVLVDAMSSFGAVPVDMSGVDYLVSSANKCLEGVPGFSFAICRLTHLLSCRGQCRVLSLDLAEQHVSLQTTGQFRFTPPTHSIIAFNTALALFWKEGEYKKNKEIIVSGMEKLGYRRLVPPEHDGHIITAFLYPQHRAFNFTTFYEKLSERGQVIYPGKVTEALCFRVGNIGHLFPDDMHALLRDVESVMREMGLPVPLQ